MDDTNPTPRRRALVAVALTLVVAIAGGALWTGLLHVPPGQMAVVGNGEAGGRALGPGWHWRWPGSGEVVRLDTAARPLTIEVPLSASDGAPLAAVVTTEASLERHESWAAVVGAQDLDGGLAALLARELPAAVGEVELASALEPATERRLAEGVERLARRAGLVLSGTRVELPLAKNPALLSHARSWLRQELGIEQPSSRVLVVGWDGADWTVIDPLLAAGRMPNLAALMARGIHGELRSAKPLLSPLVWTTIATGKPAAEHGILDFLARDAAGNLVPVSSESRKVHALWTMLSTLGLASHTVGWWATWPAEPVEGVMVSDRVAYQLFAYEGSAGRAGKVFPDDRWDAVQERLVTAEDITWEDVRRFLDVSREEYERFWRETPEDERLEQPVNHFRRILATTRSYHAIALELLAEPAALDLVYYEASDTTGHLFARFLPPRLPDVSAEDVRRYGRAVPELYVYLDELLGELLAAAGEETDVLLVSDHGFHTGDARPDADPADFTTGAVKWHRLHGIVVAAGPSFGRGEVTGATVFDIVPTVLAALGLPVPGDLEGRSLTARAPAATGRLASYEELPDLMPDPRAPQGEGELASKAAEDEERLRELAALGYISAPRRDTGGTATTAAGEAGAPTGAPAATAGTATEAYNLATMHHNRGEYARAIELYEEALARLPSFGHAWSNLANVYTLQGRHDDAFTTLAKGFGASSDIPEGALVSMVSEAREAGRLADAERLLARLEDRYRGATSYHVAVGTLYQASGRTREAQAAFARALELDPLNSTALAEVIAHEQSQGRTAEAKRRFDAAVAGAATSLDSLNQLAVVALRQGWADRAEPLLRQVLASDPGNAGILANLAATLARQGRTGEAIELMQRSIERDPSNAGAYYNLGAMLAGQGRLAEARDAFRSAIDGGFRQPDVYVAAAKMEFRLGNPDGARRDLESALAIAPAHPEARELLRILQTAG